VKIGMISQWYEPETGAAAHPSAIARVLARRGHELTVLTGFPNYPHGRLYDGYRMRPRFREILDGVSVVRVPLIPSHDASAARRMVALGSFAVSATAQVGVLADADVCLVYLTPATIGLAARVLRRLHGVPYVVYVQDLWPESVTASGFIGNKRVESLVETGIHRFCRGLYEHAESVVAISPSMARLLVERGVDPERSEVVYNWIDEEIFRPVPRVTERRVLDVDSVWLMYAGGIGDVQGLDTAIEALAQLRDRPDIRLALVGDGVAVGSLLELADRLGVSGRLRHLGSKPMAEMPRLMAEADAQLISLKDLPLFHATIPSKTQSTMACGMPMVCSVPGDAAGLVEKAGAGFTAPAGDVDGLASAFRRMADVGPTVRAEMGRAGRSYYESELGSDVGAGHLESLLVSAAHSGRRR
jgi:colanic acid biosynthesis glycosyl transferase WcaI